MCLRPALNIASAEATRLSNEADCATASARSSNVVEKKFCAASSAPSPAVSMLTSEVLTEGPAGVVVSTEPSCRGCFGRFSDSTDTPCNATSCSISSRRLWMFSMASLIAGSRVASRSSTCLCTMPSVSEKPRCIPNDSPRLLSSSSSRLRSPALATSTTLTTRSGVMQAVLRSARVRCSSCQSRSTSCRRPPAAFEQIAMRGWPCSMVTGEVAACVASPTEADLALAFSSGREFLQPSFAA
mmetsp:Transcript_139200/g.277531  ORF Transcript_139200/g.277531 Transcript_139200/m.277531 type:complete len:242 (-) Transcript_139200:562-1287(-)